MRPSARLLFAIAFIGGMDNAALGGSRASLADLLGQGYEVKATSTLSLTDSKALNEANITPTNKGNKREPWGTGDFAKRPPDCCVHFRRSILGAYRHREK